MKMQLTCLLLYGVISGLTTQLRADADAPQTPVAAPLPQSSTAAGSLADASLEDLMNIQVTSVSGKAQSLSHAGASVFVIEQEDIRRSGATNVPDLLRMAPGVEVAQIDANRWAVSIRGFNGLYSDKVLVLIDGRSIYDEVDSGVFWDQIGVPLQDIDRIEIIRGPGGTVWGANAVNGVINIISKSSRDTKGGLVSAGGGSATAGDSLVQYGGAAGRAGTYRVFGRYTDVNNQMGLSGQHGSDGWNSEHMGFRSDWDISPADRLSVQGDAMRTSGGQNIVALSPAIPLQTTLNQPESNTLGDIMARWEHTLANGSQTSLQIYYDYTDRLGDGSSGVYLRKTDVEFEHHLFLGKRHDIVWGLGYRYDSMSVVAPLPYSTVFAPDHARTRLASAFLQDEIAITKTIAITLGSKIEHNDYTGFEFEPSAQLVWAPTKTQAVWASVARAIRQPALLDTAAQSIPLALVPLGSDTIGLVTLSGSSQLKSEKLRNVEAGYRAQIAKRLSLDVSAFLGSYSDLQTDQALTPYFSTQYGYPHVVIPNVFAFGARGTNYGAETSVNLAVSDRFRVSSGYSYVAMRETPGAGASLYQVPGDTPRNQVQVRTFWTLPKNLEWDSSFEWVSPLTGVGAYARVDSRVGWRPGEYWEMSIGGQNLTSPSHTEFVDTLYINGTRIPRSVFASLTLHI